MSDRNNRRLHMLHEIASALGVPLSALFAAPVASSDAAPGRHLALADTQALLVAFARIGDAQARRRLIAAAQAAGDEEPDEGGSQ